MENDRLKRPIDVVIEYDYKNGFTVYGVIGNPDRIKLYSFPDALDPVKESWD